MRQRADIAAVDRLVSTTQQCWCHRVPKSAGATRCPTVRVPPTDTRTAGQPQPDRPDRQTVRTRIFRSDRQTVREGQATHGRPRAQGRESRR